jgi:hypothetical protein
MGKSIINVTKKSKSNEVLRKDVQLGEVFVVKGGNTAYAHMGTREVPPSNGVGYQSMNTVTGENAFSANGTSKVTIIGTWELNVIIKDEYAEFVSG